MRTQDVSMRDNSDDASNPQQGTVSGPASKMQTQTTYMKPISRVPPTKKDPNKLFVGGLPSNVTQEEFYDFFGQFGEVSDSIVMFDRDTHRSRGFGFVTYEDQDVCRKLLEMRVDGMDRQNGTNEHSVGHVLMRGKVCEIKSAEPKESSSGFTPRDNNGNNRRQYPRRNYPVTMYPSIYPAEVPLPGRPGVNHGIPNTLPVSSQQQPMMMSPGWVPPGGYYPPSGGQSMPMYALPYMGYQLERDNGQPVYYDANVGMEQYYGVTPAAPGFIAEPRPNLTYVPPPYGFIPVGSQGQPSVSPATRASDDSPQSMATAEGVNK